VGVPELVANSFDRQGPGPIHDDATGNDKCSLAAATYDAWTLYQPQDVVVDWWWISTCGGGLPPISSEHLHAHRE
jgi:hypothetical protein